MNAHSASAVAPSEFSTTLPDALQHHVRSARQLIQHHDQVPTPAWETGVVSLDCLLLGGLRRGQLVELVGGRTCGRYAMALATLAAATTRGEPAALIDLGDSLDPQCAALAGVILERLLWVRPPRLKQALVATETILGAGFPLVVLDLGLPPIPGGRGAAGGWLRLARAAATHACALFVASPYRVSGAAAAAVIRAHGARPHWSGRGMSTPLLEGVRSKLEVEKLRGHRGGTMKSLRLVSHHRLALGVE